MIELPTDNAGTNAMRINLNQQVLYHPTPFGEQELHSYARRLIEWLVCHGIPPTHPHPEAYSESIAPRQPDGRRKVTLWEFMYIFGSTMTNGSQPVSVDNVIEILED